MKITIQANKLNGYVELPASKSIFHRKIIAASLANGTSKLKANSLCDDCNYTLMAMKEWGAKIKQYEDYLEITGTPLPQQTSASINCGQSASTLRFLIPVFSMLEESSFTVCSSLFNRPLDFYKNLYKDQNLKFVLTNNKLTTKGQIKANSFVINEAISSQFISGLLFYLPLLNDNSTLIMEKSVSQPYINLTIDCLKESGILISKIDNKINILGKQNYHPINTVIEGDLSHLIYFIIMGSLAGEITINNINFASKQGDLKIFALFSKIGAKMIFEKNHLIIKKAQLQSFEFELVNNPDLGLPFFALASVVRGTSTIYGVNRLQYKESNRLAVGLKLIEALGAKFKYNEKKDYVKITGSLSLPHTLEFDSFNDHRVVFTLAAISPIIKEQVTISNHEVITKSYPKFWDDFKRLGGIICD